jgi:hypothetical protein
VQPVTAERAKKAAQAKAEKIREEEKKVGELEQTTKEAESNKKTTELL